MLNFSLTQIFLLGVGYLSLLFACAWVAEKGWLPKKLVRHPVIYILALGMYASAWAFYSVFGMAERYGYAFLTYYLGISAAFVLAPLLLLPLLRLARTHQLSSLADLFAFRYRSRLIGMLVAAGLLLGSMPLFAMQIQAIADVIFLLTNESAPHHLAFVFCAVITLFAILFGARHISLRERHESLLVAIAFESLVKLIGFLSLGAFALWGIFGGLDGLERWLAVEGEQLEAAITPLADHQWRTLLLLFFATAVSMPHIFHIIFAENPSEPALLQASWAMPVFLLLLALPVPVIYWAYLASDSHLAAEYATLSFGQRWSLVSFIVGLAAASGSIIVMTLALAPMLLNHLVLPFYRPPARLDIYYWLLWMRRLIIALLIFAAYLVYLVLHEQHDLATLGLSAFIATLQFLPGVLALLYWPSANRLGLSLGLIAGFVVWGIGLGFPLMLGIDQLSWGDRVLPLQGFDDWYPVALLSITVNLGCFIFFSLISTTSEEEKQAAALCSQNLWLRPQRRVVAAHQCADFIQLLTPPLGPDTAQREVEQALKELRLSPTDRRPLAMQRLRDQLQANLSGLMGSSVAQVLTDRYLPWQVESNTRQRDLPYIEEQLELYQNHLTGMAKELDALRRHHRHTLHSLPIGVCTLDEQQRIQFWNAALVHLTQLTAAEVLGLTLAELPAPWGHPLHDFYQQPDETLNRLAVQAGSRQLWLRLQKASVGLEQEANTGMALLIEDQTERQQLEDHLLHRERLASIGQLAAGVAHEIGNPVTGISSLVQNLHYDAEDPALVRETATAIHQLTQRINHIVQTLVSFAHAGKSRPELAFEPTSVHATLEAAIALLRLGNHQQERDYRNLCAPDLMLLGDPQRLQQVFINLLSNARDATQQGGRILCTSHANDTHLWIEIHDDGTGIDPDQQEQLFTPFYTTKAAGEGTGLGLALVYSIVAEHGGQISCDSPSALTARGSCFRCQFPRWPVTAAHQPEDKQA